MKKIVCVILLCASCVYGGGDDGVSIMLAKQSIKSLRALGIGYCLGYDTEKLYDEFQKWIDTNEADRNNVIDEIKAIVDTDKSIFIKPTRKYDKTALFEVCFLIDGAEYREAIQHIAEKYCVKRCREIKHFRDTCTYFNS